MAAGAGVYFLCLNDEIGKDGCGGGRGGGLSRAQAASEIMATVSPGLVGAKPRITSDLFPMASPRGNRV